MIKCNNCGAKNLDNAKICAVCGKEINSNEKYIDTNAKNPWYGSTWFIILMFFIFWPIAIYLIWKYKTEWLTSTWFTVLWLICFPPVGFYLMWKYKKFNNIARIIITVSVIVFWAWFIYEAITHPEFSSSQFNKRYTMKVSGITTEEIGDIEFKVPEYYDVRVTNDDVYNVYFYPEREDAQASLGFILMNQNYSAEQVKSSHENIINNWKQTFANIQTEEEMRDNNYILKATGSRDGAKMKAAALVNNSTKKTVILVLSVDDTDTTGIAYFEDFDNMIKSVIFENNKSLEKKTDKELSTINIDYYDERIFEEDLVAGKKLDGKTVIITCKEIKPQSLLGFNIWAGEHLNLVSKTNPGVNVGDRFLIRAKEIQSSLGSWIIRYEFLNKIEENVGIQDNTEIKYDDVNSVINDYNNEIDTAKNQLHNEIDNAAESLKDEMGVTGKLFGGYIDEYKDTYKDAVNEAADAYKDAMKEYSNSYDDIMKSFGY